MTTKLISLGITAFSSAALILGAPTALAKNHNDDNGNSNAGNKVTICHATGSATNPYVMITPNVNGIISGHGAHQDQRDIIPPFDYNSHGTTMHFAGQNWDLNGQAILANGCKITGGQGGSEGGTPLSGGQGGTINQQAQVLGASVAAGQALAAQGGVNAGAGGAASHTSTLGVIGLSTSLGAFVWGAGLLNRRLF